MTAAVVHWLSVLPAGMETPVVVVLFRLVGLGLLACFVAGLAAFLFRWRTGLQLPEGPGLLLGLGAVAIYLNTRIALIQFIGADGEVLTSSAVAINLVIFASSAVTATLGWYVGDKLGTANRMNRSFKPTLSPLVRATGRFITVELPAVIADIEGYDPVAPETKAKLAGRTYNFSRGLTVEELKDGLTTRLTTNHDIAHVDADFTADGTLEFLAVGRRATGIGPTLPPGERVTAIRADPAYNASSGDRVQIYEPSGTDRIGTAELRATAGETVTVSARSHVIDALDPTSRYRLLTLAATERVDRTFASMLRRAEETVGIVEVAPGATLDGMATGDLGIPVVAITDADGNIQTIPPHDRTIVGGDRLSLIGHPRQLRMAEAAAKGETSYERPAKRTGEKEQPTRRSRWRPF